MTPRKVFRTAALTAMILTAVLMAVGCACNHEWIDATCTSAAVCAQCGEVTGEPAGHDWIEASCQAPRTCSACGLTDGAATAHSWVEADCEHAKTCTECGTTEGTAKGHFWRNATCTTAQTCDRCGATKGEPRGHIVTEASCTEPSVCTVCGQTRAVALGHDWQRATCTSPKTCARCRLTEGDPLPHNWEGDKICGERRKCADCQAQSALIEHSWRADGTCKLCDSPLTVQILEEKVQFAIAEDEGIWEKSGEGGTFRYLLVSSRLPLALTIKGNELRMYGTARRWVVTPHRSVIDSTTENASTYYGYVMSNKGDDRFALTKPTKRTGADLGGLVVDMSKYEFVRCSYEMDLVVGEMIFRALVSENGTTWTRVN